MSRGLDHFAFMCQQEEDDMRTDVRRIVWGDRSAWVFYNGGYLFSSRRVQELLAGVLRSSAAIKKPDQVVTFVSPDPEVPLPTIFAMANEVAVTKERYTSSMHNELRRLWLLPARQLQAEVACFTLAKSNEA